MNTNRNKNVFGQSRWQIISSLRKKSQGVKELSQELNVTENAIRPHLAMLERDGIVRQKGIKQSGGKPAHIFELSEESEQLFPKAYGVLLSHILTEIQATQSEGTFNSLLETTAKRFSRMWPQATGNNIERMEAAVSILNELGGLAEVSQVDKAYFIKGYSCPLADATKDHPGFCYLAQLLLEDLTGLNYERCCTYDGKPKCRFKVISSD